MPPVFCFCFYLVSSNRNVSTEKQKRKMVTLTLTYTCKYCHAHFLIASFKSKQQTKNGILYLNLPFNQFYLVSLKQNAKAIIKKPCKYRTDINSILEGIEVSNKIPIKLEYIVIQTSFLPFSRHKMYKRNFAVGRWLSTLPLEVFFLI